MFAQFNQGQTNPLRQSTHHKRNVPVQNLVVHQQVPHEALAVIAAVAVLIRAGITAAPVILDGRRGRSVDPVQRLKQLLQEVVHVLVGDIVLGNVLELERPPV